jgi:hypothetical protein
MTPELFETLLYQNESETLDFKVAQYAFEKATAEQKSELLKDILAFANAWRQTDAYILIGVEEKRDAKSVVTGLNNHLSNRNLQQFVASKTNRPVFFSYSSIKFEDKEVGILHIPIQDRPVFLIQDFGLLRANVVYIRRGETTGQASPDEVLRMASTAGIIHRDQPTLGFEYGDPETRERWGQAPDLSVISYSVPPSSRLPDYGRVIRDVYSLPDLSMKNRDFYRHLASYIHEYTFVKAVAVAVDNTATALAEDVSISIKIDGREAIVRSPEDMPSQPSTDHIASLMVRIDPHSKTSVSVSRFGNDYEVVLKLGNIQPGTTVWSADPFFIGARANVDVCASIRISANNLRFPKRIDTKFKINAESRSYSVDEVKKLAEHFE